MEDLIQDGLSWWDRWFRGDEQRPPKKFESLVQRTTGKQSVVDGLRGKLTLEEVILLAPKGNRENPETPERVERNAPIDHLTKFTPGDMRIWEHFNRARVPVEEDVLVMGVQESTGLIAANCTYTECRHEKRPDTGTCYRIRQQFLYNPKFATPIGPVRMVGNRNSPPAPGSASARPSPTHGGTYVTPKELEDATGGLASTSDLRTLARVFDASVLKGNRPPGIEDGTWKHFEQLAASVAPVK